MDITNNLKKMLLDTSGKPTIGSWFMSGSAHLAEAYGLCGFDFLVVDMEHAPIDIPQAANILRAIDTTPSEAALRVPWNDKVYIKRALDAGAQTLVVPFVENVAEAKAAVAASRYPGAGVRGVAAVHRASRFGTVPDYFKKANDQICMILQLETPEAVDQLEDIAAIDGVDVIFIGPADLAANMGYLGEVGNPAVQAKLKEAAARAKAVGIPAGALAPTPEMSKQFLDYGFTYMAMGTDLGNAMASARSMIAKLGELG